MTSSSVPRKTVNIDREILNQLQHLDMSGLVVYKNRDARGQGAFSEVFMGNCHIRGHYKVDVAIKRLRFHIDSVDCKQASRYTIFRMFRYS